MQTNKSTPSRQVILSDDQRMRAVYDVHSMGQKGRIEYLTDAGTWMVRGWYDDYPALLYAYHNEVLKRGKP